MKDLLYADEVYGIQGAIFGAYRNLGSGFLEAAYQECLEMELNKRGIPFSAHKEIRIEYKGVLLEQTYRANEVCHEKIILELKVVKTLLPEHSAQLLNYLRATGMKLGLLENFSHYPNAEVKRIAL